MGEVAYLNGRFLPLSEASVSVDDRGFLFGDSVYEVARTYAGRVWALDRHLARLARSLDAIDIRGVDLAALRERLLEVHQRSAIEDALIYLQITRGVAPRAHLPNGPLEPTVLITVRPVPGIAEAGWRDGVRAILMPEVRWARRDIKSTNLLPNILAKREAHARGATEAIFVTDEDLITEGSSTNVFAVKDGVLRTPPKSPALLHGITRDLVLETAARLGVRALETPLTREALLSADEVLITGTVCEVTGVVAVDGAAIGEGVIGPVTRQLHAAYRARVAAGDDAL